MSGEEQRYEMRARKRKTDPEYPSYAEQQTRRRETKLTKRKRTKKNTPTTKDTPSTSKVSDVADQAASEDDKSSDSGATGDSGDLQLDADVVEGGNGNEEAEEQQRSQVTQGADDSNATRDTTEENIADPIIDLTFGEAVNPMEQAEEDVNRQLPTATCEIDTSAAKSIENSATRETDSESVLRHLINEEDSNEEGCDTPFMADFHTKDHHFTEGEDSSGNNRVEVEMNPMESEGRPLEQLKKTFEKLEHEHHWLMHLNAKKQEELDASEQTSHQRYVAWQNERREKEAALRKIKDVEKKLAESKKADRSLFEGWDIAEVEMRRQQENARQSEFRAKMAEEELERERMRKMFPNFDQDYEFQDTVSSSFINLFST